MIHGKKTNTVYYLYVKSKKYSTRVNVTKKKLTHRYREQTSGYGGKGGEAVREWGVGGTRYWVYDMVQHGEYSQYFAISFKIV